MNHYAGSVAYTSTDFCEKNKDLLAVDLVQMMQKSKSKFFAQLFENQASDVATPAKPGRRGGGGGGSVAYKSVSATFKTDLSSLMEAINAADPHFVRCVNPNSQKKAQLFENQKAVEQLRCGGVIEAVRMCRESYPSRYTHQDFYGTFNCLCPNVQGADFRQKVSSMLQGLKVEATKFRLGQTMVLLKREVVDNMERMRAQLLGGRAMVLQNTVRRFIAKQELNQKRDLRRKYASCVKLQSICRRTITRAKYVRMVQAVRLQERKRREEEVPLVLFLACVVSVDVSARGLQRASCWRWNYMSLTDVMRGGDWLMLCEVAGAETARGRGVAPRNRGAESGCFGAAAG